MADFTKKSSINRETKLCISLSARPGNFGTRLHNFLFGEIGLDYIYKSFRTADIAAAIGGIRALGIRGCAISMPFKESCIPLLDSLDSSAAAIGSVNTIVNDDGHLRGYNTDYIAIFRLIDHYAIPADSHVILRGSGGMAKAVASAFGAKGFKNVTLVARNVTSGQSLARATGFGWVAELPTEAGAADGALLVNVTPMGMAGGPDTDALAFPLQAIAASRMVFDVVAIPADTPLVRAAKSAGRVAISGNEVAIIQSVEQFILYTGVTPTAQQIGSAAQVAVA